jgi:Zn-finger nucleic acid-binding protein
MKCPVCANEMIERDFGGVTVDVCADGCQGLWFDWFELMKLDEENEGMGGALKNALESPRVNDENRERIFCPKCGIPMHVHKHASNKEINVDECYACAGFFLDSGELRVIREDHMTEEERQAYADKLVAEIPEHDEAVETLEKEKARVAAIDKFTRYLRLSNYI